MDLQKESPSEARDVRILARRRSRDDHGLSVKGGGSSTQYDKIFSLARTAPKILTQWFVGTIRYGKVGMSLSC